MTERKHQDWVFKKEISVGDIVAFCAAAIAVVAAYFTLDKRLALVEDAYVRQAAVDKMQDDLRVTLRVELQSSLNRMDDKLDAILLGLRRNKDDAR